MNRANKLRGEVAIELGNKAYTLRPTFEAIIDMEEQLGGIIGLAIRAGEGAFGLREATIIVQATLHDPETRERIQLDRETIGAALLDCGISTCLPAVRDLLAAALGATATDRP